MGPITERIDAARSRRGMFKRDLMQLIGVGEHRWERAKNNDSWSYRELAAIAVALKVSVQWLLAAGDDWQYDEPDPAPLSPSPVDRRVEINGRLTVVTPGARHGNRSTYAHHGCRCAACTRANTEWLQRNRARRRAEEDNDSEGAA